MDWIKNLNRALTYIEENLDGELDYDRIVQEAHSSKFHFMRIFNMITGKTLGEYIKERRLTLAVKDLQAGKKVIDIALKYGYENPGAFSLAFKRFHSLSPSKVHKGGSLLTASPPLYFSITVKGEEQVKYRIEKKESMVFTGPVVKTTLVEGQNRKDIPAFWGECGNNGTFDIISPQAGPMGVVGLAYDFDKENGESFTYMLGVEGDSLKDCKGETCVVPSLTWAIFSGEGKYPDSFTALLDKIYKEWFPATMYREKNGPHLEVYTSYNEEENSGSFEIWIPVEES